NTHYSLLFFIFVATPPTKIYPLSLHDALPICGSLADATSDEIRDAQQAALFSTVHGAGRVMSRTQAAGKRNRRTGKVLSPGRVRSEEHTSELQSRSDLVCRLLLEKKNKYQA